MRQQAKGKLGWGIVLLAWTLSVFAQSAEATVPSAELPEIVGQLYREIDDPNTGDRWLLLRDTNHPGGPGRLVLADKGMVTKPGSVGSSPGMRIAAVPAGSVAVIHAGDPLEVETDTTKLNERLEAIALGPAASGALFEVRLKIGGKVFRAVALGPGRAAFAAMEGGRQ